MDSDFGILTVETNLCDSGLNFDLCDSGVNY